MYETETRYMAYSTMCPKTVSLIFTSLRSHRCDDVCLPPPVLPLLIALYLPFSSSCSSNLLTSLCSSLSICYSISCATLSSPLMLKISHKSQFLASGFISLSLYFHLFFIPSSSSSTSCSLSSFSSPSSPSSSLVPIFC